VSARDIRYSTRVELISFRSVVDVKGSNIRVTRTTPDGQPKCQTDFLINAVQRVQRPRQCIRITAMQTQRTIALKQEDILRCRLRRMMYVFIYSYRSRYSGSFAPLLPSSLIILFDLVFPSSGLTLSFLSLARFFF